MKNKAAILLAIFMWFSLATKATEISRRQELESLASVTENLPQSVRAGMIVGKYRSFYPKIEFASYGAIELRVRFDAADVAEFYSHDEVIAAELLAMYKILFNKGLATSDDHDAVIGAQVLSRSFESIADIPSISSVQGALAVPVIESKVMSEEEKWQILTVDSRGLTREVREIEGVMLLLLFQALSVGFLRQRVMRLSMMQP